MRLLQCGDDGRLSLTKDLVGDNIPRYAILSHTWGSDTEEVTLKDFVGGTAMGKPGYKKITFCAEQALRNGLQYFWVDTCCIDKSNKAELDEAINSMFRWYHDADLCYAYLSDVSTRGSSPNNAQPKSSWEPAFRASRWFTRGWTLQELLAPALVEFFSREGTRLGDKGSLKQQIHEITGIPILALQGTPLSQFLVEERFSWIKTRQTTRAEDIAYCLLGIFGVFIPLIYGEGSENAMRRLTKEINDTSRRQEWLRKLYLCPYRDRKDRNPSRVKGTCEWFTNHSRFRSWQQGHTASLLWVSADPGCGKSVLAKYLADDVLPSTNKRTTCYFFFKEDFEDQRSSVTALCSILHQVFDHHPASFSTQILERFEDKGATLLTSFGDLWDILISIATSHKWREIVCILDALDECEISERNQLIDAISKFCSGMRTRAPALKFLLTSRPYVDIKRRFRHLECDLPMIHLKGENEEEIAKISHEIDMVIRSRVMDISRTLELSLEEQNILAEELTRVPSRTYLWAHLVFDEMENGILLTPDKIRSEVRNIPRTVSEAYNRILSKSRDISLARKLLHIVVAAARPLTLQEMALALAIGPEHRSIGDLYLAPEEQFRDDMRQLCGLFVVVADSKVYLLHQTAREFLVPQGSSASPSSKTLLWQFSLHPKESHRILAEICIQRLSLIDFNLSGLRASADQDQYIAMHIFLQYAAQYWADHFREANWNGENRAVKKAILYCFPDLPTPAWFEIYQRLAIRFVPGNFTPLLVASYLGLSSIVERLPKKALKDINVGDSRYGRSAVSWAAGEGHDAVLQRLLGGGVVRRVLGTGARINAKDKDGSTPLHWASVNGHDTIVQRLLEAGADTNVNNKYGSTPLYWASENGHDTIVQRLLEAGADANAKDPYGSTPLHWASENGHDTIVQRLLEGGADANAKNEDGRTPLHLASENGHNAMVQRILEAGANTNVNNKYGSTPLHLASKNAHAAIVQQLLEAGAQYEDKL